MHEVFLQRPVTTRERERERERDRSSTICVYFEARVRFARPGCRMVSPRFEVSQKNVSKVTFKLNTAGTFHDRRSYVIVLKQSFRKDG